MWCLIAVWYFALTYITQEVVLESSIRKPPNEDEFFIDNLTDNTVLMVNNIIKGSTKSVINTRMIRQISRDSEKDAGREVINGEIFKWEKTDMSPIDYQLRYCQDRCNKTEKVKLKDSNNLCPTFECMPCSCVRPLCEIYDICCPDISIGYIPTILSSSHRSHDVQTKLDNLTTEVKPSQSLWEDLTEASHRNVPKMSCYRNQIDSKSHLYIRSCMANISVTPDVVRLCEDNIPDSDITFDSMSWAVDAETHVLYRNVYCARCNGVREVNQVPMQAMCTSSVLLYKALTNDDVLRIVEQNPHLCYIHFNFSLYTTMDCKTKFFGPKVIDSCPNGIGQSEQDAAVARACNQVNGNSHEVHFSSPTSEVSFKNIFCAMCKMKSHQIYSKCTSPQTEPVLQKDAFRFLLDFRRRDSQTEPNDLHSFVNDTLVRNCSPGKYLVNNTCITALPEIRGLTYRLQLWFLPIDHHYINAILFLDQLEKLLNASSRSTYIILGSIHTYWFTNRGKIAPAFYWIDSFLEANVNLSRDDYELDLTSRLIKSVITFKNEEDLETSFKPMLMLSNYEWWKYCKGPVSAYGNLNCVNETQSKSNLWSHRTKLFLNFSAIITCVFVSFKPHSYKIKVNEHNNPAAITVTLRLNNTILRLTGVSDLNLVEIDGNGVLNVCHDLIGRKLEEYKRLSSKGTMASIQESQYILTIISMAASMLSLVLTLVSYFRLASLRTFPGLRNMVLCISLFLAQASLLASSHLSSDVPVCPAVGIATHFLWLWMFFWTLICSFYMHQAFASQSRNRIFSTEQAKLKLIKNIFVSMLPPSLIVVTIIVFSLIESHGQYIGYGSKQCYLDLPFHVGVAMGGPLLLIGLVNLTFFVLTVVKINKVLKLAQTLDSFSSDTKRNLYVYAKLFSLTGTFWTLAMIAEGVDNDILRFLSIPLNGLQGVFIFISFVCNKRVLKMHFPDKVTETNTD